MGHSTSWNSCISIGCWELTRIPASFVFVRLLHFAVWVVQRFSAQYNCWPSYIKMFCVKQLSCWAFQLPPKHYCFAEQLLVLYIAIQDRPNNLFVVAVYRSKRNERSKKDNYRFIQLHFATDWKHLMTSYPVCLWGWLCPIIVKKFDDPRLNCSREIRPEVVGGHLFNGFLATASDRK